MKQIHMTGVAGPRTVSRGANPPHEFPGMDYLVVHWLGR